MNKDMDTKAIVLERLKLKKLGKKSRFVGHDADGTMAHAYLGDEIAMEVTRYSGAVDFVMGRYDNQARLYRIAYDPNIKAGPIKSIDNAYSSL